MRLPWVFKQGDCISATFTHIREKIGSRQVDYAPQSYSQTPDFWDYASLIRVNAIALGYSATYLRNKESIFLVNLVPGHAAARRLASPP
jgi:hypothetical protein